MENEPAVQTKRAPDARHIAGCRRDKIHLPQMQHAGRVLRIVYFGSCGTMRTKHANIDDFLHRTKADILAGYRKDVDFIQATAWELCCFFNSKTISLLADQIKRLSSFVLYEFSKL